MSRLFLSRLFLPFVIALAASIFYPSKSQSADSSQTPNAEAIQKAMNEGVELEFAELQELSNVKIVAGGVTQTRDCLFVCEGTLSWKIGKETLKEIRKRDIEEAAKNLGEQGKLLTAFAPLILASIDKLAPFEAGDTVTKVRFRVRLESAGEDWIATSAKLVESGTNPLRGLESRENPPSKRTTNRDEPRSRYRNQSR